MNHHSPALVDAARELIGCKFRLYGRDPATGLDCVGLVATAVETCGGPRLAMPAYALRQQQAGRLEDFGRQIGLISVPAEPRNGDVVLFQLPYSQLHLAIKSGPGLIIHAHAGLRRVVESEISSDWLIHRLWRLA